MVLWCRLCGALMGLREPLTDWSVDRNAICHSCVEQGYLSETVASPSSKPEDDPLHGESIE